MNFLQLIPTKSIDAEILPYDGKGHLIVHKKLNHYIKVTSAVIELLKMVDGKRTIKELSESFNTFYNKNISGERVYQILYEDLGKYNIIENSIHKYEASVKPTYLSLSIKVLPEKAVAPIAKFFLPLFSRKKFYPIFITCLLFVVFTAIINAKHVNFDMVNNLNFSNALFIGFGIIITLFLHEFGHASACKCYGGNHKGIGFGFYLLRPVMFADVSDIWKLKIADRVKVNLGGIQMQLIMASIFGILFLFTQKIELLILVYLVGIIGVIANLNPFFRTDGYWVLSDLTDVSNLRDNSNKALQQFLGQIINKTKYNNSLKNIFLVVYALISNLFIIVFLVWIVSSGHDSIVRFPITVYTIISDLFKGEFIITYTLVSKLIVPALFYMLLVRFLKGIYKRIGTMNRVYVKEVIWIGINMILAITYLLSAVGKTLDFLPFQQKIAEYLPNVSFVGYVIIGTEYFLALSFATLMFTKIASKLSILLLLLLSTIYSYGYFKLGIKECDCFGSIDILNSSKIQIVLIKNLVLLLLSFLLITKVTKKQVSYKLYKSIASISIVFLIVFQVFKLNAVEDVNFVYKNIGTSIYKTELLVANNIENVEYLFLFSPNCVHCKKAIPYVNQLVMVDKKVVGITITEKKEDLELLKNAIQVSFPVHFITREKLKKVTKKVPILLKIKNDTIVNIYKKVENYPVH